MNIVSIPLSELKRPERNVRIHPEKQIKEMMRSLDKFQQTRALVVDESYTVLVGNGILTAMERMGYQAADCHIVTGLSEAEKKKLMLADNQIQRLGIDDAEAFDAIIAELGKDIDVPGYDEELLRLLNTDAESADDMFSGYGIIEDDQKQQFAQASERYTQQEEAFAASAEQYLPNGPGNPLQRPSERIQGREQVSHGVEMAAAETAMESISAPTPLQRRFLICPKCGEKIWL
ncbi:MAG: hypothetical protein IJ893_02850 [Bacteroidales bacterium]|nr:hypothetical protein [Bacteroidales bacterium]